MIRFILADLRRMWLGGLAVILLVALATALGTAVTLQERALRLGSARAADKFDLVIGAAGSETQLVLSSVFLQPAALPLAEGAVLSKLQQDPRVAWAAPLGFGDSFIGYPIVGTTRSLIENTTSGFASGQIFATEGEAVVGAAVALSIGDQVKPMHGTAETGGHTHTELAYTVVGKLAPTGTPWDRAILVPIQAVWHVHGLGHDRGDEGSAAHEHEHEHEHAATGEAEPGQHHGEQHQPDEQAQDAAAAIDEHFGQGTPGLPAILVKPKTIADAYRLRQEYRAGNTLAVFPGEVLTKLYATLGDAKAILALIAGGAQALVAAALVLVTVMHVGQRRRQIGALRAFGAPRLAVLTIVWLELFLLTLIGIILGFVVGYAAAIAIASALTAQSGVVLPVEFVRADATAAAVLLAGAAALALIPAFLAYRQSPAAALRG